MPSRPLDRPPEIDELEPLPIMCRETIPPSYMDRMQHMNVMWYTHLFSRASLEFLRSFGMDEAYWTKAHSGTFAIEAHIRYFAENRLGHEVAVRTRALGHSAKRIHFMHFMVNETTRQVTTTGEFISAHIDMRTRRTAAMPEDMLARIGRICADHRRLDWPAPTCGVMHPARSGT
jgi:acyl-CoA thioester hydrolase